MRVTLEAIRAAHDALERTSVDPAPIEALRRAVRGASTPVASSCSPSETDLVLNAALVHEHLFNEGGSGHVIVPRGSCVALVTAAGAVALDASGSGKSAPYVSHGEPRAAPLPTPSVDADPTWSQARAYYVPVVIYGGPVTGQAGVFTVKHVGGMWRVVAVSWTGSA